MPAASPTVGLDDVLAVVTDATDLALDAIVDAAFAGNAPDLEAGIAKAQTTGDRRRARSSVR